MLPHKFKDGMKVFKFGGISINSVERISNLGKILQFWQEEKILLVVSAMGKTTNALEKVVEAFVGNRRDDALQLFDKIKKQHITTAKYVLVTHYLPCEKKLKDFFTEVEWLLHDEPQRDYDYYYDQIVCIGELLSTTIISAYLNEIGLSNTWLDVRDIIRTNDDFRNAAVDWPFTSEKINEVVKPCFEKTNFVLTQGFIGATDENESTTLGREGSDFTAALFANVLDATDVTFWKDVESVMNADPKQFETVTPINTLNYKELIEMSFYGAQVIHPKTIKPLQNKNIPLYVKCFIDPDLAGTIINNQPLHQLPPIIVLKEKQVLLKVTTKDFSFVGDHEVGQLYGMMEELHLKPNLTQIGAIDFTCVLDDWPEKIEKIAGKAASFLDVALSRNLSLLTIRHYTDDIIDELTKGKQILLRQQTTDTVQMLLQ